MSFRCVSFNIEERHYGLHLDDVVHIIRFEQVLPVPGAPALVEGVLNLRGDVVPVVNLRRVFGLEEAAGSRRQRVIVVRREARIFGLLVDGVREIQVSEEDYQPGGTLPNLGDVAVLGVVKWQGETLTILDVFKLLAGLVPAAARVK
jgi:purine-binding chemotaxis protein CheW